MSATKPLASLSLDLDNKWSYLKTHGEASWTSYPTYLPLAVPRILQFLRERNFTITFFVVGMDADRPENLDCLHAIAEAGHEIGNHSYRHEPWLHLYAEEEIEQEIATAETAIERATGRRPIGFRGPGYSLSPTTLRVLSKRGYAYDASTFPTFLGPLARTYYFATARLSNADKRQRAVLFGGWHEGFRPLRAYQWPAEVGGLLEVPVTTFPWIRAPIHLSYVIYLSKHSERLAQAYFRAALCACRVAGVEPSILLHPLDFLGADDEKDLGFFPGMDLSGEHKLRVAGDCLDALAEAREVLTMERHAHAILTSQKKSGFHRPATALGALKKQRRLRDTVRAERAANSRGSLTVASSH